jgi:hypothetical protein
MTMTAPQIRQTLDNWLAPGATLPSRGCLNYLKISWAKLKPNLLPSYHPIIDDRITEVESRLSRQPEPEPRQKTGYLCPTDGWVSSDWPD